MTQLKTSLKTDDTQRYGYRVVPAGDLWKVAVPGDGVAVSFHATKEAALARAMTLTRREHRSGVLVFGANGLLESVVDA